MKTTIKLIKEKYRKKRLLKLQTHKMKIINENKRSNEMNNKTDLNFKNIDFIQVRRKKIPSLRSPQPNLGFWLAEFQLWDNAERLLALQEVIKICEPSQVRHMMSIIEPLFQRDFISLLPRELALKVLNFLSPVDLIRSAQTCGKWRILAQDNLLWREKCRHFNIQPTSSASYGLNSCHQQRMLKFWNSTDSRRFLSPTIISDEDIDWRGIYLRHKRIEWNWRKKPINNVKILRGHDDHVITCLQFDGRIIVSGSDDNTLKVWCAQTGRCLATLTGHSGGVWSCEIQTRPLTSCHATDVGAGGDHMQSQKHVIAADVGQQETNKNLTTSWVNDCDADDCNYQNGADVPQLLTVVSGSTDRTLKVWQVIIPPISSLSNTSPPHSVLSVLGTARDSMSSRAHDSIYRGEPQEQGQEINISSNPGPTLIQTTHLNSNHNRCSNENLSTNNQHNESCIHNAGDNYHQANNNNVQPSAMRNLSGVINNAAAADSMNENIDVTDNVADLSTWSCLYTLVGHTSTVRCMSLKGEKVVSGSRDATLRIWDIRAGTCLGVMIGHVAAVRCVAYEPAVERIVSGAYDYTVKVWDAITRECLHTLHGHTNRVYSLQFDGQYIVSGSLDTTIRVWDCETGVCLHTLVGHQSLTSRMELSTPTPTNSCFSTSNSHHIANNSNYYTTTQNNTGSRALNGPTSISRRQNALQNRGTDNNNDCRILVSGNADSTVKIWNIRTGQCLHTLQGLHKHQSAVTCLQYDGERKTVITSSDDGTVKLWDAKTGEFIRDLVHLHSGGSGGVVWRIKATNTQLVCAVGSRNGTEDTKLLVLNFEPTEEMLVINNPCSNNPSSNNNNNFLGGLDMGDSNSNSNNKIPLSTTTFIS